MAGLYSKFRKLFLKSGRIIATVMAKVEMMETKIISIVNGFTLNFT